MPRGRPAKNVPCEDCIRNASSGINLFLHTNLCDDCLESIQQNKNGLPDMAAEGCTGLATSDAQIPASSSISSRLIQPNGNLSSYDILLPPGSTARSGKKDSTRSKDDPRTYLESCSRDYVDAINARDWSHHAFDRAAPDIVAERLDVFPATHTLAAHIGTFQSIVEESPTYHMEVEEITANMADDGLHADVFITVKVTGRPPNVIRHSVGQLKWEKRPSGWTCVSHIGMRSFEPAY